jgi:Bifunctional DNA primase/polymerase, N-terminal
MTTETTSLIPDNFETFSEAKKRRTSKTEAPTGEQQQVAVYQDMRVLPLVANSKRPAVKNGLDDATTNKKRLNKYFRGTPNTTYGVRTGGRSNSFVVDLDEFMSRTRVRNTSESHFEGGQS